MIFFHSHIVPKQMFTFFKIFGSMVYCRKHKSPISCKISSAFADCKEVNAIANKTIVDILVKLQKIAVKLSFKVKL